jgi:putative DNA methylase
VTDHRFIEESFPVKSVSEISAKEKYIRHGHISTLHVWWARRPLAASRATAYAALTSIPDDIADWQRRRDLIMELSKWENSLDTQLLEQAHQDILEVSGGRPPRVLDPFAGGGSIPLEALRLGCETYANDYNPVAVLILKAALEYPRKFGQPAQVEAESDLFGGLMKETRTVNPLLEAVKKWGDWVLEEARKELERFYPLDPDSSIPVGYIWARTIPCQNPGCSTKIPLMRQFWLVKKPRKKVALYPDTSNGQLTFRLIGDGHETWPKGFDANNGTVSRAVATCPLCGNVVDANTTRYLFQTGEAGQEMMAVVLTHPERSGKSYRAATEKDRQIYHEAKVALQVKREKLALEWGLDPVPDEPIHTPDGKEYRPGGLLYKFNPVVLYGMTRWGDLFNARQKLALITFTEKVRQAYKQMIAENTDKEVATAVVTYLGLAVDMTGAFCNTLARWENTSEAIKQLFSRQALQMLWDYAELNPFSGSTGSWEIGWGYYLEVLSHCSRISSLSSHVAGREPEAKVSQSSATQLPYPDAYFDAVFTDPPYYDNVPYADLSDFFYVWLKRTVGDLHPGLFSTLLTPKSSEAIAELPLLRGMNKSKAANVIQGIKTSEHFEQMLKKAFCEIHRVLSSEGIAVIVYAHKSTAGWETLVNSLLDSGLVMIGAWPLHTEMGARLRARESAALASSIYIIARKMARKSTGFYNEVREELRQHLNRKLHRLWEEGIGGADFFIAAIGSGIEVFGKYEQVMDYEGNVVRADRLLEDVRTIATDYAVRQILQDGFSGEVSDLTRLYVLWRWEYGEARVPFDEARKLAQSCGVDLAREWGRSGFVRKEKEFVRLVGPKQRKLDDLEDSREMIDVLHRVLLLWEKNRREELVEALASSGYGRSEAFYRVAQAVSETLPNDSKEKKLLDGFLVGRERVREEVAQAAQQGRLFE